MSRNPNLEEQVWTLVQNHGADGARTRSIGDILAATAVEIAVAEMRPKQHCQNGCADVCWAGFHDGICCPPDSCDIDDGIRPVPDGQEKR